MRSNRNLPNSPQNNNVTSMPSYEECKELAFQFAGIAGGACAKSIGSKKEIEVCKEMKAMLDGLVKECNALKR